MKPTQSQVVQDPVLSNVSIRYSNDEYIADQILPVRSVSKRTGKYFVYDKSNFRIADSERSIGDPSTEVEYGLSKADFSTADHALKQIVPDQIRDQAEDALDPMSDATEQVTDRLLIEREDALADWMQNTSNISQNVTLSGTDQWNDGANSDPFGDIKTGRSTVQKATGKKPNTFVMGQEVFDELSEHPDVIDRVKYSQLGIVTEDLMAQAFKVDNVLVGSALKQNATEGQADDLGYIWGKHAWLAYVSPTTSLRQVTFGWTFEYERKTKRWYDEDREGTFSRVNMDYVQKIAAEKAAYLIKNAVA